MTQQEVVENYAFLFIQSWEQLDVWEVYYTIWKETSCFRGHKIVDGVEFFLTYTMFFEIPVDHSLMDPLVVQAAAENLPYLSAVVDTDLFDEIRKWLLVVVGGVLVVTSIYYVVRWYRTPNQTVPEPEVVPAEVVEVPWEHVVPWWLVVPLVAVLVARLIRFWFRSK